ncbi:transporter arsB isoform X1 [Spatholobus suberectus]|nr:transporter arsB isoform X1 [Spatholobus suberectus]
MFHHVDIIEYELTWACLEKTKDAPNLFHPDSPRYSSKNFAQENTPQVQILRNRSIANASESNITNNGISSSTLELARISNVSRDGTNSVASLTKEELSKIDEANYANCGWR